MLTRAIGKFRQVHKGPSSGGTFWALEDFHDLPTPTSLSLSVQEATQHGRIWMQDARDPGRWQEIRRESELPEFSVIWQDDYDACTTYKSVIPFAPEFYFIPRCGWAFCPNCQKMVRPNCEGYRPLCSCCWERISAPYFEEEK